jgi:hypothetical protein
MARYIKVHIKPGNPTHTLQILMQLHATHHRQLTDLQLVINTKQAAASVLQQPIVEGKPSLPNAAWQKSPCHALSRNMYHAYYCGCSSMHVFYVAASATNHGAPDVA